MEPLKCERCAVNRRVLDSNEPAVCAWYLENVVCGTKNVSECTDYEEMEGSI